MDAEKRITMKIKGLDEDGGDVRLNEFVQQLGIFKKALLETQKLLSDQSIAYFKIVELQKNSPAQIVIEAVPFKLEHEFQTEMLVRNFFSNIRDIDQGEYPPGFTHDTFEAYKDLTSLREKKKVAEIIISKNGDEPNYLLDLPRKIDCIVGLDEYEMGSYTGMLESINIHNQNIFHIYPISHFPKLKCIFSNELKREAIAAIGRYVTVYGRKKFKSNINNRFPYEMYAQKIEVHPEEKDLPTLSKLRGIAPNITGGKSSEDFIRGIRNGW
ncbi:MAG: hypothetical protein A2X25_14695 [Chloroflexi bacterium GWB2_49_20]|nr:MAG: hypothetical protein A2X25_14695 [Chloroflexi bacterium GWB2_49_20]OGN77243.1 MAG: hypothetical protein A2X26_08550 [Chloroflexi bacterium GWC2_49_37]OGN84760.1 MAG: hypothetical protein A2X27_15555 [Chloroflexi bacterium GWD2_49_16]